MNAWQWASLAIEATMASQFLNTSRLRFDCWKSSDLELALQLWGDQQVTRLFYKEALSRQQIIERLYSEIESSERKGVQYWPLFNIEDGDFVGCCGLKQYGNSDEILELGIHLRPKYWGKGLAVEAGREAITYAFDNLKIKTLFAGHHPENKSSRGVLVKLGFIGKAAQFYEPTGLVHPCYLIHRDPPACTTRLAQPNDAYALALVHYQSICHTFSHLLEEYVQSRTLDDFERAWRERIEGETCTTNILVRDEQIVGFASVARSDDDDADGSFGDLDRIYLHPCVSGNGYGSLLLDWCLEALGKMGYTTAKLWVFEVNSRALRFYEKHGFCFDGKRKEAHNARLLRYSKAI